MPGTGSDPAFLMASRVEEPTALSTWHQASEKTSKGALTEGARGAPKLPLKSITFQMSHCAIYALNSVDDKHLSPVDGGNGLHGREYSIYLSPHQSLLAEGKRP